ncbi:LacI family transcriptional regulator [Actinomyces sp. B33]|uniref:LacI family DNA-binding transcriptional regulator n=1 Tax=Actinomyces sp. B33 TaxID=2942131 RepID=UPI0023417992|nr:LacI family DNA-binding transcriptional regulator [Actinomyces sp. B33]MDC4232246.1 LacI family transcriptional regulator [Actinomyces sp. B33]
MNSMKRPTRDDVARLSGVSSAVVSYVLNDGPRPVSEQTRQKVLAAVRELDYRPNSAARAFRLQKSNSIGLLVPDISNPFFAELARAVREEASTYGYALILNDSGSTSSIEQDQIRFIAERQPDGVIIIGRTAQTDLSPLRLNRIPAVALDATETTIDIPTISIDDYTASLSGIDHLKQHGHTRIAMIAGPGGSAAADARVQAWQDVTGLRPNSGLLMRSEHSREAGFAACRSLLDSTTDFTALFVASDIQAIGALRALHEAGRRIPEDCATLSFDGTQEARFATPPLSVIEQPLSVMAAQAVSTLLGNSEKRGEHIVVTHSLRPRASCGCSVL